MAVDRNTVLHNAQLFAARGQFDAAIAEWKKLTSDSPTDGGLYNSIGDLHLKRNSPGEAITAYLQAAAAFRAEGATLKAIATYKKILKVDPSRYEVYRHLGDLNAERGLLSSAVQDYLTLGKYYLKERKTKEALEVYRKIVNQDPGNLDAQQRMAELCLQENLQDEAAKVYLQLGRERSANQRYQEARDAYLAVLRVDPNNSEARQFVEMVDKGVPEGAQAPVVSKLTRSAEPSDLLAEATRRMELGQYEGAEAILHQVLSREPGNPVVCQLLARVHLHRGELQVALGEYRFLAGAALRAQDHGLAESLIAEYLKVEPNCVPMLELLGELYEEKGDPATAAVHLGRAVEVLVENPEPGMPTLHLDIFDKIKAIAPTSPVVASLTARLSATVSEVPSEAEKVTAPLSDSARNAPAAFTIEGAAPDDQWEMTAKLNRKQDRHFSPATEVPTAPVSATSEPAEFRVVEAQSSPPAPSRSLLDDVRLVMAEGRAGAVEQPLVAYLQDHPDDLDGRRLLAQLYEAKGDTASAALHYSKVLESAVATTADQALATELYRKIKDLAPASPILAKLATTVEPPSNPAASVTSPASFSSEVPPSPMEPVTEPPGDCDTHYALGVAYKNMGLFPEAVEEFEIALQSSRFFVDASLMLALCLKEQAQPKKAIAYLEQVLASPHSNGQKTSTIRYELGLLYEAAGEVERALHVFEPIPTFHDVRYRLESLRARAQAA